MNRDRIKILIADDEEIVRESLSGWLEKDGYTLDVAEDGPKALEKLKADKRAILITDLKMPGMDGLQLLAEAKKLQPDLTIVIMTAYATWTPRCRR
jgi:CheY-like chemotaxis protein